MFNKLTSRYIATICIVFVLLYSLIAFLMYGNITTNVNRLNLLESPQQTIYGKSIYESKILDITLDEIGVALVVFTIPSFNTELYSQLDLSIENLPYNYQAKLVIVTNKKNEPKELSLLQPNGKLQSNLLVKNSDWQGEVKQIGLRILPQHELGLSLPLNVTIKVKNLSLNNKGFFANYFTLFNYWSDYEPWEYLTISHFKIKQIIPIYAQPLVFVFIWILLCLIFLIKTNIKFSFMLVFLAWISLDVLFLDNMKKNKNWIDSVYSQDNKILPDNDMEGISTAIKAMLKSENLDGNEQKDKKIFILTPDKYQGIRLVYHLLPLNAGFLNIFLPSNGVNEKDYILSYAKNGVMIKPRNGILEQSGIKLKINTIARGDNYILMSVVK